MTILRNNVKNALLALIATATFNAPINNSTTWITPPSRRLKLWNAVDPSQQPAAFLVQHREGYTTQHRVGQPLRIRYLDMGIWCYASSGDPTNPAGTFIGDELIDIMETALEVALAPDNQANSELTLGGLVPWARIERTDNMFVRDPGDIDGQALLILPVRILLP